MDERVNGRLTDENTHTPTVNDVLLQSGHLLSPPDKLRSPDDPPSVDKSLIYLCLSLALCLTHFHIFPGFISVGWRRESARKRKY